MKDRFCILIKKGFILIWNYSESKINLNFEERIKNKNF